MIIYWDGTNEKISIHPKEIEEFDIQPEYELFSENVFYPSRRASASMIYIKRNKEDLLVLYGGYTNSTSFENIEIQEHLSDLWVFSIKASIWKEAFPNSDVNPEARFGANMIAESDVIFYLFGGANSKKTLDDFWQFNIETNMWTEIKRTGIIIDNNWPKPSVFASISKFKSGLILYGGYRLENIKEYVESLLVTDDNQTQIEKREFFNKKKFNHELWSFYFTSCDLNNCFRGKCQYGRCMCDFEWWGEKCDMQYCPNSYCYYDKDIIGNQICYHCSGNGRCFNRKCVCDLSWTGPECNIKTCENDCSNDPEKNIINGECVINYPLSTCKCDKMKKRGGDYCQIVYCLNDCSKKGVCDYQTGICKCDKNYYGENCSIFFIEFQQVNEVSFANFVKINIIFVFIISLLIF